MCGINGFIGTNPTKITKMNKSLFHRGPDFAGTFIDDHVSLGHTLLSIREVADSSKQPYTKENSPWILLFNGQIYNTEQLKKDLPNSYTSVSLDTAILFATIEKYGWDFITKIHGMFTIALYNKNEQTIKLYRDPSGQKHLYYYQCNGQFIFSSEIKGILAFGDIDKTIDEEAISLSLNFGYLFGNKTIFSRIKKLEVSSCLSYDIKNKKISYDFFNSRAPHYYDTNPEKAFTQLINEHLLSKQEVAINLSGGLDSSILFHLMSDVGHEITSYTTRFDIQEGNFNHDADLATRLAKDYGATHKEILVTRDTYLENFIESYKVVEEPNYNISLPIYFITAKQEGRNGDHKRVILSGDGGDELFSGYPYYKKVDSMYSQMKLLTPPLYTILKNYRNHTHYNFKNSGDQWAFFKQFSKPPTTKNFNHLPFIAKTLEPLREMYANREKHGGYDAMLADRFLWQAGENFVRSDKQYMHESIEIRSPLSYHPFRLHFDTILSNDDYQTEAENKIFLRRLFTDKLPDYIIHRTEKTGWRAPIERWYDKRFKNLFLDIISNRRGGGIVDWPRIKKQLEESDTWPGKTFHLYLSLAILADNYNIDL